MATRSSAPASVSIITARRSGEGRGEACAASDAGEKNETIDRRSAERGADSEALAGWERDAIGLI